MSASMQAFHTQLHMLNDSRPLPAALARLTRSTREQLIRLNLAWIWW